MENVTLTPKEQTRVRVLNEVNEDAMTAVEAAGVLGISLWQVRQLPAGYRRDGVASGGAIGAGMDGGWWRRWRDR